MSRRRLLVGLVAASLLALSWVAGSVVASVVPADGLVAALGNDYILVVALAGVALAAGLAVLVTGRPGAIDQARPPDPERALALPTPGDEFEAATRRRTALLPLVGRADRRTVRRRLREAAVQQVMRSSNCSREAATRRVADGSWTDDAAAALFLANAPPLGARVGATLGSWRRLRPWSQVGARRTARAIVVAADAAGHDADREAGP